MMNRTAGAQGYIYVSPEGLAGLRKILFDKDPLYREIHGRLGGVERDEAYLTILREMMAKDPSNEAVYLDRAATADFLLRTERARAKREDRLVSTTDGEPRTIGTEDGVRVLVGRGLEVRVLLPDGSGRVTQYHVSGV